MATRTKRSGSQLSPDQIIEAVLRIAERGGSDAFTVRRLGEELGADPTAIYRHFRDKDELLLSVADRAFGEAIDGIPAGLGWKDRLRALAAGSLRVALKYPVVVSMTASRTTRREREFLIVEFILECVHEAGLQGAEAALLYRSFGDALLAFIGQTAAFRLFDPDVQAGDLAAWAREYRTLDPTRFPHITRLSDELAAVDEQEIFDVRVEAMLSEIERRAALTSRRRAAPAPEEPSEPA
ncbi:MAG: TetR/AcrR family transcriptional regulator [Thermoactinospora sp.]|nr:TetR/AcrR family transcriptional regulator [Thermoactinospora sp.]